MGKGTYRVLSGSVVGAELADGNLLAHRCAFPEDDDGNRRGMAESRGRMAGPRIRRARHG